MTDLSLIRLHALRAGYLLVGGGLLVTVWPSLIDQRPDWPLMNSVVAAMLGAVSLLALLGLRYPLQMLPILLFELAWKAIWLGLVALPLWASDRLDERTVATVIDCLVAVLIIPIIPWGHVARSYVLAPGARWRRPQGEKEAGVPA